MSSMYITHLSIVNFKSYQNAEFQFVPGVQLLTGPNGAGKTNVLDAIYFAAICRSYFALRDKELTRHGEAYFRVRIGYAIGNESNEVVAIVKPGASKVFEKNKKVYDSLSQHIGQIPVVMVTPNDTALLTGFSEERRRFLDYSLCQVYPLYLQHLMHYNKLLAQRNAFLKQIQGDLQADLTILEALNAQMAEGAAYIYHHRDQFVRYLADHTSNIYGVLSGDKEGVSLKYVSDLDHNNWGACARQSLRDDIVAGRTTRGIHRDDIEISLDRQMAKKHGSQGQVKSVIMALKLSQFLFFLKERKIKPILMLDDIFDRLDRSRVMALMQIITGGDFGQVFITDTESDRVGGLLEQLQVPFQIYQLEESQIKDAYVQTV